MSDIINPNINNGREHRVGADLYDWEYNNTYNIDTVVKDIKGFIDELYTHSLYSQEVLCDISRICGSMADFKRDINVNVELGLPYFSYTLEVPIKNVPCFKTLALRRANPKIYTIKDTCTMTDLFERRLMMFVDGEYFYGIKFYADSNRFVLIIEVDTDPDKIDGIDKDTIRHTRLKQMIENKSSWSIILMPFSRVQNIVDNVSTIFKGNRSIDISVDKYASSTSLHKYSNINYVDSNLWLLSVADQKETSSTVSMICTARVGDDTTNSAPHDNDYGHLYLDIPAGARKYFKDNGRMTAHFEVTAIPNAGGVATLYLARSFQIQFTKEMENPIPPQNILVFEIDKNDAFVKYIHDVEIKMYYPNIYKIENVDPSKYLVIVWCYSRQDTTSFTDPLELYINYNIDYPADVINNELPVTVKDYVPMVNTYRETNYLKYFIRATRRTQFTYKFNYLKELIKDNTTRLEKIYTDMVTNTAYKWHSNPRYYIDLMSWGDIKQRVRRDTSHEVKHFPVTEFGMECVYFIIEHEDDREYPVAVWVDGVRCMKTWIFTEEFRSYVYIPYLGITGGSHIEFEIMKVRSKKVVVDLTLPKIHNSIEMPKDFVDISPQNLMISRRIETSDVGSDGGMQYIYKVAPDYEMYWLIISNTEYKDAVPVEYIRSDTQASNEITDVTSPDNEHYTLTEDNNTVISESGGSKWVGGALDYLMENGFENYINTPSAEFPDDYRDYVGVGSLGYYKDDRRRFYEYLPNGELDDPIFITPITDYFAEKTVRIQNTDIYWSKTFTITKNNKKIKLTKYVDEPINDRWRIYLDGKLLIPNEDYVSDANVKNGFYINNIITIVILKPFEGDTTDIFFEYIPYKYGHLYSVSNVNNSYMQLRESSIKRPFSLVYYDMYIDGEKVRPDEVEVITPSKIHILRKLNNSKVAFFERRHDPDIYNNERIMQKSLVDYIAEEDKGFRNYLLNN